jgi:hypothetical protein
MHHINNVKAVGMLSSFGSINYILVLSRSHAEVKIKYILVIEWRKRTNVTVLHVAYLINSHTL